LEILTFVTIPKDTIDRFELNEGTYLSVELDTDEIKRSKKEKGIKNESTKI